VVYFGMNISNLNPFEKEIKNVTKS